MTTFEITTKASKLPENLKDQVSDFIDFLLQKYDVQTAPQKTPENILKLAASVYDGLSEQQITELNTTRFGSKKCDRAVDKFQSLLPSQSSNLSD